MEQKYRNVTLDLLKGYGIILLVAAHAGVVHGAMISMFHMAIFFIASGYCYNTRNSEKISMVGKYVIRRLRRLYIPFILWNSFFLVCRELLFKVNIYTDNPAFLEEGIPGNGYGLTVHLTSEQFWASFKEILLFQGEQQLEGASWFLRAMFSASVFFVIYEYLLGRIFKKNIMFARWISAIAFLLFGGWIGEHHIILRLGIHSIFSIYFLLVVGMYLSSERILLQRNDLLFNVLLITFTLPILLALEGKVSVNLNDSVFSSLPMFVLVSLLGWLLLWAVSNITLRLKLLMKFLNFCGKHTLIILMMHFICFKLVSLIQVAVYGYPNYALAAFPCLNNGVWAYAYIIVGVGIPLAVAYFWDIIIAKIKKYKMNNRFREKLKQ